MRIKLIQRAALGAAALLLAAFLCAPPAGAKPQDFIAGGEGTVRQTYLYDFDQGREQQDGADLWFNAADWQHMFLVPRNGAVMAVVSSRPYRDGCIAAGMSAAAIPLTANTIASYICVRTDTGKTGFFKITHVQGNAAAHVPLVLSFTYALWASPMREPIIHKMPGR